MPIVNGSYVAPTWNDNAPPAITASELNAMSGTIESNQYSVGDIVHTKRTDLGDKYLLCNGDDVTDAKYNELKPLLKYATPSNAWKKEQAIPASSQFIQNSASFVNGYYTFTQIEPNGTSFGIYYSQSVSGPWEKKLIFVGDTSVEFCGVVYYLNGKYIVYSGTERVQSFHNPWISFSDSLSGTWTTRRIASTEQQDPITFCGLFYINMKYMLILLYGSTYKAIKSILSEDLSTWVFGVYVKRNMTSASQALQNGDDIYVVTRTESDSTLRILKYYSATEWTETSIVHIVSGVPFTFIKYGAMWYIGVNGSTLVIDSLTAGNQTPLNIPQFGPVFAVANEYLVASWGAGTIKYINGPTLEPIVNKNIPHTLMGSAGIVFDGSSIVVFYSGDNKMELVSKNITVKALPVISDAESYPMIKAR